MRLDPDCVRDVLLAIEGTELGEYISPRTLHRTLPQYSEAEIEYTCLILSDGDFLQVMTVEMPGQEMPGVKSIIRLTFQGHEFISKIRDPQRWPKLQKAVSAVRDYSLSALNAIANGATAAGINALIFD
uniref:DUF2513 domain-containing protein n=1 Tax=uncultured Flavonifractor sp. TaxID=1193534 RepID=UPI002616DB83|nr:DUF2513 domain-containing protein [uncultured Flavonifractor sp.]